MKISLIIAIKSNGHKTQKYLPGGGHDGGGQKYLPGGGT